MKKFFLLLCVLVVAILLRFWRLGDIPISLDWDETALGYNAYSILKTGKDEYGTFLPLSIRSFDDYKPPLYTYLTVPSVALFGLSPWSTRLPSAVMGVLAVVGTYFLVKALFSCGLRLPAGKAGVTGSKEELSRHSSLATFEHLPFISSFLLAISPWHIQFSRIAFEANIGITVNIWAVTCFLIGLRKKSVFLLSAFLFGLGMYAYHSQRVFLPLLLCLLLVIYRRLVFRKENRNIIIGSLVIGVLTVLPLIPVLFNKTAMLRLRGTSSFTDQTGLLSRNITKLEDDRKNHDNIGELLDNRRFVYAKTVISGYLSHFSLKWLFMTGDNPRHHAPDMGLLYFWELPFFLCGMYMLLRTKNPTYASSFAKASEDEKASAGEHELATKVLFGWFLIAPIVAAPTTGLPHAIRTLVFLPVFQIFTAFGIVSVIVFIKELRTKNKELLLGCFLFIVFCLAVFNIMYYFVMYFSVMNREYSEYWQYGYKEAVAYTESMKDKYEKVVVSTGLEQSYMFFLFYTKYDPIKYLAHGGTKSGSFEEVRNTFDKYEFRTIDWSKEKRDGSILYVGAPGDMPHGNVANISFLNGKPAIEIADQPNGAP